MIPFTLSAPGKLMIAGEYGALRPGGVALALAVGRRLRVTVEPSPDLRVTSALLGLQSRRFPSGDPFIDEILDGCPPAHVTIRSELSAPGAPKGGLGSSAALVVALAGVKAKLCGLGIHSSSVIEWALRAHLRAQGGRGSGYDVFTCGVGGVVAVPGPEIPYAARAEAGGSPLLEGRPWEARAWPKGIHLGRVQSDAAADTRALIERAKGADPAPMMAAARDLLEGITLERLDAAQRAFEAWDRQHKLGLMTPDLTRLAAVARGVRLIPRVSGAGGGDSLLIFSRSAPLLDATIAHWRDQGRAAERLTPAQGLREDTHDD